jgi:hypothetical protein
MQAYISIRITRRSQCYINVMHTFRSRKEKFRAPGCGLGRSCTEIRFGEVQEIGENTGESRAHNYFWRAGSGCLLYSRVAVHAWDWLFDIYLV